MLRTGSRAAARGRPWSLGAPPSRYRHALPDAHRSTPRCRPRSKGRVGPVRLAPRAQESTATPDVTWGMTSGQLDRATVQAVLSLPEWTREAKWRWGAALVAVALSVPAVGVFLRCVDTALGSHLAIAASIPLAIQWWQQYTSIPKRPTRQFALATLSIVSKVAIAFLVLRNVDLLLEDYFFEFSYTVLGKAALVAGGSLLVQRLLLPLTFDESVVQMAPQDLDPDNPEEQETAEVLPGLTAETLASTKNILMAVIIGQYVFNVVVGPFLEEILFRGVLLTSLAATLSGHVPVATSALLFSLSHEGGLAEKACYFWTGVLLGVAFLASQGNLLLPILAHSLSNAVACGASYFDVLRGAELTGMEASEEAS